MSKRDQNKSLIVVGGGITGLVMAYMAASDGRDVTILEASDQLGGLLRTFEVNNEALEFYYHHFFTHDQEIRWLIDELGIGDKLIFKKTKMGIYHKGKIYNFSTKRDLFFFNPLNLIDKIRFALTSVFLGKVAKWRKYEGISAINWLNVWAGKKVAHVIWGPLLKVKFGTLFNQIPLSWLIGRLSQRLRSRKGGDELLGYLDGSLKSLLDALMGRLEEMNVKILVGTPVDELIVEKNSIQGVKGNNQDYQADQVVLTIPCEPISKLLQPHHSDLVAMASQVEYLGAVCVVLELKKRLSDIYWLNIADEKMPFGGIIEHTNFIDEEKYKGAHIVYLSRYFPKSDAIASMTNEEIEALMVPKLKEVYPEFEDGWIDKVHIFKTRTAATFCDLDFSQKVLPVKLPLVNLFIANMVHIYPDERSVNNSIRVAAEACTKMGINVKSIPQGTSLSAQIGF